MIEFLWLFLAGLVSGIVGGMGMGGGTILILALILVISWSSSSNPLQSKSRQEIMGLLFDQIILPS